MLLSLMKACLCSIWLRIPCHLPSWSLSQVVRSWTSWMGWSLIADWFDLAHVYLQTGLPFFPRQVVKLLFYFPPCVVISVGHSLRPDCTPPSQCTQGIHCLLSFQFPWLLPLPIVVSRLLSRSKHNRSLIIPYTSSQSQQ